MKALVLTLLSLSLSGSLLCLIQSQKPPSDRCDTSMIIPSPFILSTVRIPKSVSPRSITAPSRLFGYPIQLA